MPAEATQKKTASCGCKLEIASGCFLEAFWGLWRPIEWTAGPVQLRSDFWRLPLRLFSTAGPTAHRGTTHQWVMTHSLENTVISYYWLFISWIFTPLFAPKWLTGFGYITDLTLFSSVGFRDLEGLCRGEILTDKTFPDGVPVLFTGICRKEDIKVLSTML